ncbi:hypothetical protein ACQ86G_19005 [Roseateles chitinivorans]|uniref:hypothetical protein n=1 Tax=Roseateles chitinivorans TaxID=2917965 RepID=UPI003D67F1EC
MNRPNSSQPSPPRLHRVRAFVWSVGLISAVTCANATDPALVPPGVMLQQGEWRGDVGTHLVPAPFDQLPAAKWPMDGWVQMSPDPQAGTMTLRPLQAGEARTALKPILSHRQIAERGEPFDLGDQSGLSEEGSSYVRIPGSRLKAGVVPLHRFKNGTTSLVPELGYRFQLKLGELPYAFTLQNGFRTADGRPYGEGTQFTLEIGGQRYEYDLGGYGWEVRIDALGDFDGDGRPDFLFYIGGSNSSNSALVLSSQAKPGKNPPTTYLTSVGC